MTLKVNRSMAYRVPVYTTEQLKTLWEYATPWERCLLTLGLNCGFMVGEIATLRRDEVYLRQPHPLAGRQGFASTADASWIRRIRNRTGVYSEWKLWPTTVAALDWLNSRRSQSILPQMVLTKNGTRFTMSGQRNIHIKNAWTRLSKRVKQNSGDFPTLRFSTLRKTAADHIERDKGGEIASLFLSHHHHAFPPFAFLHQALDALWTQYASVFATIDNPFPHDDNCGR